MTILLIISQLCFLGILFYYQKKEQNYIGYTTVLTLMFSVGLLFTLFIPKLFENENKGVLCLLIFSNWVFGSVIIYITSQLTLAFEKISQLSRHIAIQELEQSKKQKD
jgi:hypothetical protein